MSDKPQQEASVESTDDSIDNEIELREFVLRRARSLLKKKNLPSDLAEDIGQQTLLKFHEIGSERRRLIENHKAYLSAILRHELENYREPERHIAFSLDSEDRVAPKSAVRDSNPEHEILLKEVWSRLEGEDRRLFELLILGYRGPELAMRFGISKEAARKRTSRLIANLNVMLTERPGNPQLA